MGIYSLYVCINKYILYTDTHTCFPCENSHCQQLEHLAKMTASSPSIQLCQDDQSAVGKAIPQDKTHRKGILQASATKKINFFLAGIFKILFIILPLNFSTHNEDKSLKDFQKALEKEKLKFELCMGSVTRFPLGNVPGFSGTLPSCFIRNKNYCPVTLLFTFNILSPL